MLNNKSRIAYAGLLLVTGVLLLFALAQAAFLVRDYQQQQTASRQWAEQQTLALANDLAQKIQRISSIADQLAEQISAASCSPCDIEKALREHYLRHTDFTALGLAFDAETSGTAFRLYAPFIRQKNQAAAIERLDSFYDYLANQDAADVRANPEAWYTHAQQRERQWLEPFYEAALGQYVIRYTAPIYNAQQQKIGLVFVDTELEWLHDQIEKYDIKDNNYLSLESAQGKELYHSFKGIAEIILQFSQPAPVHTKTQSTVNVLTDEPAWQHNYPIAATQWQLHSVISKSTIADLATTKDNAQAMASVEQLHKLTTNDRIDWVVLVVVLAMLIFSCARLRRKRTSKVQLWFDTAIYTIILFSGVISIWILEYGTVAPGNSIILANQAIIQKFERDNAQRALIAHNDAPVYVPVGLFIQSIEFLSASNVNVTGYVWHRYQEGQESDYEVGTVFPEAIETNISLAYEKTVNGETLKGWYFETTLRENFNPDRFPLDRQSVWIRLWHEKIGDNIVLVPDLKAYNSLNTRSLPGIEKDFVLAGWSLLRSYFEVRENQYNTRLGIASSAPGGVVPELYFNVEIMRNFINPFLAHLFPLFVVVLMLYAIVITMSTDEEKKDFLGFNAAGVVASCSALFFVALISHVQLRNELAANSVVYLEYFYLITYVLILLITLNAVLLSLKVKFAFIQFHDNLLPKLIYWPAISGALFMCTVWAFRH